MTLNDFLEAIAKKLIARWPVRHVFVNRIPAEADGNFYVRVIETTQEQKLDRRRVRTTRFEVCYLQADSRLPDAGQVRGQPDAFRQLQQVIAAGGKKALHMPGAGAAIQGDGVAGAVQIPGDQRAPAPAADDGDAHIKIPPAA